MITRILHRQRQVGLAREEIEERASSDRPLAIAAMILIGCAGVFFPGIKPLVLSAYKDYLGFGDDYAGYLVGIETSGAFLGAALVTLRIHVWDRRAMGALALAVMLAGNVGTLSLTAFSTLAPVRLFVGLGEGLALGVMSGSIAGTAKPDRVFAIYTAVSLLAWTAGFIVIPSFLERFGMDGIFILLGVILLPAALLLPMLPRFGPTPPALRQLRHFFEGIPVRRSLIVVAGAVIAYFGIGGFSPFIGEIGRVSGLEGQARANVLAFIQFCGFLGAMAAGWQNLRWGRSRPLLAGLLLMAAAVATVLLAPKSAHLFAIAMSVFLFMWLYFFAYLAGVTSTLDPGGRVTTLFISTTAVGFAAGPAIDGWLAERTGSYAAMELLTIALLLAAVFLIIPVARQQDQALGR